LPTCSINGGNAGGTFQLDAGKFLIGQTLTISGSNTAVAGDEIYNLETFSMETNLTASNSPTIAKQLNFTNYDGPFLPITISGNGTGTAGLFVSVIFSNITSLTCSSIGDTFTVNAGVDPTMTLNGGTGTDTLLKTDGTNTWAIGSDGGGTVGNITFTSIETLTGGTGVDTFNVEAAIDPTMTINGGTGTDILTKADGTNTWAITSDGGGTVGNVTFTGVETVTGGTGVDTF